VSGPGIDYSGPGSTDNRDTETGIRYGIIPLHALGEVFDDFESVYTARCPHCGEDIPEDFHFESRDVKVPGGHLRSMFVADCTECGKTIREDDQYGDEPDAQVCENGIVTAHIDSSNDVWFTKSLYFTRASFCSPCAPGACHLNTPCDDGERCYCPGHDWFEGGEAPFPVYSVETGERVERAK
jgi:DNA-directed RNA polymerase subunit RPC12/RpoP